MIVNTVGESITIKINYYFGLRELGQPHRANKRIAFPLPINGKVAASPGSSRAISLSQHYVASL